MRDALLGHAHLDWDLATSATPTEVMRTFRRTVPVGLAFGTVGVLDANGRLHEVTTFRHDVKTDGRHAEVEFGASLEEDLARRDFTINAIAYNPQTGELRDPFNGRKDLRAGIVRAVGDPDARMKEDRLRALRALRFASRFGFEIELATWKAICNSAPFLTRLSAERVKQEIEKTMEQVERPSAALSRWRDAGALRVLVPLLQEAPPDRFAALDFLPLPAGKRAGERKLLRLAMLFFGEQRQSTERACRALKFSNHDTTWITRLADARARLGDVVDAAMARADGPTDAELRRWAADVGRTAAASWWRLNAALWCARRAPYASRVGATYHRLVRIAYRDAIETGDLQVDGEDLALAGVPKGPELGATLRRLLDAVIENPALNRRDELLRLARGGA
ncbi:MAG: CCA tRNA nucleotidyltransferase [Gemmatimonadetes bacterium]|nr:CCA tRNA nucleotidyltransferase [Gemmatimonadota bacterium]